MKYLVKSNSLLLRYLLDNVKGKSKNNIKSILKNGCVSVNGKIITRYDYELKSGDVIIVTNYYNGNDNKFDILYEDNYLIAVNKRENLLTVSTDKEKNNTLYRYVSNYVKSKNKNNKIFIVNRLDRDTSGIVIFAKNKDIKEYMQNNWERDIKLRKYITVVDGVTDSCGIIKSYLKENNIHIMYSSNDGLLAITEYKLIKQNNKYSMLEVILHTGRKNQIRVHMNYIKHPVIGDTKYSNTVSPIKRMCLHAIEIKFVHPVNKNIINIKTNFPDVFNKMFD